MIKKIPILAALVASSSWLQCVSSFHVNMRQINSNSLSKLSMSSTNNNVVLRPTLDNPEAFDSYKIGSARVHRYVSPSEDNDDTEYLMWYHGRSINDKDKDANSNLAPLSTGQIGYATSKNGLHWEKMSIKDEMRPCLGPDDEAWWGFDTAHVGLGQVLQPTSSSAAMQTDVGAYMMYYMGGDKAEAAVSKYIPNSKLGDNKIMGMNMCIGIAISQDGIHWGRLEGEHPNGSVLEPDDKELYCAWPDVIKLENMYAMHYSTLTDSKQKCINFATSEDGFIWEKRGTCITPSIEADEMGLARSHVMYDDSKKSFVMFYDGISAKDNKHRICAAVSDDGISNWRKLGVVLDLPDNVDEWDSHGLSNPHAIELDDGTVRMYYIGQDKDGNTAVGVARCMKGEGDESYRFEREQAKFVFTTEIDG